LRELQGSNLMRFSAEIQLDIGLMLFIVIADSVSWRIDIKDQLLECLLKYLGTLLEQSSPIVQSRCLIILKV